MFQGLDPLKATDVTRADTNDQTNLLVEGKISLITEDPIQSFVLNAGWC
jgi:hypothetical protein